MRVVIVGGTHGNEKTGVFVLQKLIKNPGLLPSEHLYKLCFGNPKAIAAHKRYVDFDLNRSFGSPQIKPSDYENSRCQELKTEVLEWAQGDPFFLIDLHTTTSNMGTTLVLSKRDRLSAHVAAGAKKRTPNSRLVFNSDKNKSDLFVESIAPHGLLIEVGPVAQNTYDPGGILQTETALSFVLGALTDLQNLTLDPIELQGFREGGGHPYPTDKFGNISACIHPQIFGKDFQALKPGDPIFLGLNSQPIAYEGQENITPIFIGEAAYLETGSAFTIAWEESLQIP